MPNLFFVASLVGLLFQVWTANQKMSDLDWKETSSTEELRLCSHQVISFPVGNHHDAFIALIKVGNKESIPYLISALRWQKDTPTDGLMDCEKLCCLKALRKLTNYDAGLNYLEWQKWWESH